MFMNFIKNNKLSSDFFYPIISSETYNTINYDRKNYITLINPINIKGIDLFEKVAFLMSDYNFLIVKGWKETDSYKSNLSNIKVLDYQSDIQQIWNITNIYLGLSIWKETYGRVMSEAILNGTQLIANDIGGICESSFNQGILITPIDNLGSEIYPKFKEDDLLKKSLEIKALIIKNWDIDINKRNEKSNFVYNELCKNEKYINDFIENLTTKIKSK